MSHFDSPAASLRFYLVADTGTLDAKIADRARTNRSVQILWEIPPANEGTRTQFVGNFDQRGGTVVLGRAFSALIVGHSSHS